MGRLKLFDDEQNDYVSKIEINEEYAKRLEHNKKREELQRYEELKKKGVIVESDEESDDESTESEEDNDDSVGSSKRDLEFFNALLLVKKKHPSLKEKDVKLFGSESDGSEQEEEKDSENEETGKKSKNKAMYLKDVMAKHFMEEGPEFEEERGEEIVEKKKKKKSYSEEQEEIRKAFLDAVKEAEANEEEEDDGFLKEKKNEDDDKGDVEDDDNEEFVKKLDEYFGGDGDLDENKLFLKEFFKNKMWVDKEKDEEVGIDEEVKDLLREDEELERQEQYEISFRHEEGMDDRVLGHSRKVEGSVRKKENARKEQRKSKEERMKIAEIERKEELKHLKNLKKKEMKERMKKVMTIAGFKKDENLPLNLRDLDDEFDPEEYDRMMKAVFDDKYYDAEDVDPGFGSGREEDEDKIEKPDFDKEDELLGLPKGWDVIESGDGFKAARERSLKCKLESGNDDDNEDERMEEHDDNKEEREDEDDDNEAERVDGVEEEEVNEESKRKRKRKMSLVKKAKEEMLEEFYKLDYEDTIGDLKTRFKYAKVKPNRYGLKTEEVLLMDDKELNQYVSVKKLAPYREEEWKVPNNLKHQQKLKNKELLQGRKLDGQKSGKKRSKNDAKKSTSEIDAKGDEKAQLAAPNSDISNLSKRAKTRRRQAKPKLSQSRLMAYGKIPSKGKIAGISSHRSKGLQR